MDMIKEDGGIVKKVNVDAPKIIKSTQIMIFECKFSTSYNLNSKFLSSDIITEFRGRKDEIKVYPLSFKEFYSFNNNRDKGEAWKEYITYGGLPLVLLQNTVEEKVDYLNIQKNNVYINDVVERNDIQNEEELKKLISYEQKC